jgi:hypothetical protein
VMLLLMHCPYRWRPIECIFLDVFKDCLSPVPWPFRFLIKSWPLPWEA